jgi:hypothetical protein
MDTGPLPEIFSDLVSFADSLKALTVDDVERYCSSIQGEFSAVPELLLAIGPVAFLNAVTVLGGQNVRIPRPEEILKEARNVDG